MANESRREESGLEGAEGTQPAKLPPEQPIGFAEVIRELQAEADRLRIFGSPSGLRRAQAFERGADVVARVRDDVQFAKIKDQFRWK